MIRGEPTTPEFAPTRHVTGRGFVFYQFFDRYNEPCTLQQSSLATEDAIWFGREDRMHLTQEMVATLLPLLQTFADTGELP